MDAEPFRSVAVRDAPLSRRLRTEGRSIRPKRHRGHTATLLPDGRVLIVGGHAGGGGGVLASAEVWDPVTASFDPAGLLAERRAHHTATPLPDDRVLVIGRCCDDGGILASAEVWGPSDE